MKNFFVLYRFYFSFFHSGHAAYSDAVIFRPEPFTPSNKNKSHLMLSQTANTKSNRNISIVKSEFYVCTLYKSDLYFSCDNRGNKILVACPFERGKRVKKLK